MSDRTSQGRRMSCAQLLTFSVVMMTLGGLNARVSRSREFCKYMEYRFYNGQECQDCPECRPGQQHRDDLPNLRTDPHRGALSCFGCESCPGGRYNDRWSHAQCSRCRSCDDLNRETAEACTKSTNTECGQCLKGYHDVFKSLGVDDYTKTPCEPCSASNAKDVPAECQGVISLTSSDHSTTTQPYLGKIVHPALDKDVQEQEKNNFAQNGGSALSMFLLVALSLCLLGFLTIVAIWMFRRKHPSCRRLAVPVQNEDKHGSGSPNGSSDPLLDKGSSDGGSDEPFNEPNRGKSCELPIPIRTPTTPPEQSDGGIVCGLPVLIRTPTIPPEQPNEGKLSDQVTVDAIPDTQLDEVTLDDIRLVQRSIGKCWKDLGRALRLSEADIEKVEIDESSTNERIFQLLHLWKKTAGQRPVRTLCEALNNIDRYDVSRKLITVQR